MMMAPDRQSPSPSPRTAATLLRTGATPGSYVYGAPPSFSPVLKQDSLAPLVGVSTATVEAVAQQLHGAVAAGSAASSAATASSSSETGYGLGLATATTTTPSQSRQRRERHDIYSNEHNIYEGSNNGWSDIREGETEKEMKERRRRSVQEFERDYERNLEDVHNGEQYQHHHHEGYGYGYAARYGAGGAGHGHGPPASSSSIASMSPAGLVRKVTGTLTKGTASVGVQYQRASPPDRQEAWNTGAAGAPRASSSVLGSLLGDRRRSSGSGGAVGGGGGGGGSALTQTLHHSQQLMGVRKQGLEGGEDGGEAVERVVWARFDEGRRLFVAYERGLQVWDARDLGSVSEVLNLDLGKDEEAWVGACEGSGGARKVVRAVVGADVVKGGQRGGGDVMVIL